MGGQQRKRVRQHNSWVANWQQPNQLLQLWGKIDSRIFGYQGGFIPFAVIKLQGFASGARHDVVICHDLAIPYSIRRGTGTTTSLRFHHAMSLRLAIIATMASETEGNVALSAFRSSQLYLKTSRFPFT